MNTDKPATRSPVDVPALTPAGTGRRSGRESGTLATALLTLLTLLGALLLTAPSAEATDPCTGTTFNGRLYCPGTIWGVKSTTYGVGAPLVLHQVAVAAKTTNTVTVQAGEFVPCPPGHICGASMTLSTLTVPWSGKGRPTVGKSIDVYGTTTTASLTPSGYVYVTPFDCTYC
jgi:hypothetical protein